MDMFFDLNQTKFKSELHRIIWTMGRQVVPFEISTAEITDNEMLEGLKQVYDFAVEHYLNVFANPDVYLNIIDRMNAYLNSVYKEIIENKVERMLNYFNYLPANKAIQTEGEWVIKTAAENDETLEMLDLLAPMGIRYEIKEDLNLLNKQPRTLIIKNVKYPLFIKYLSLFHTANSKNKVYASSYITFCDFRVFNKRYSKTVEETMRLIPANERKFVTHFYDFFMSINAKPKPRADIHNEFTFKYKKQSVLTIKDDGSMNIHLGQHPKNDSADYFFNAIENLPNKDEFKAFIVENNRHCKGCKGKSFEKCSGRHETNLPDKHRYLCLHTFRINKATREKYDYDLYAKMLKQVLDLRIESIDNSEL